MVTEDEEMYFVSKYSEVLILIVLDYGHWEA